MTRAAAYRPPANNPTKLLATAGFAGARGRKRPQHPANGMRIAGDDQLARHLLFVSRHDCRAPLRPGSAPGTSHARPIQGEGASDLAGLFALLLAGAQPVQADVALPADPTVHQHHAQLPAAVAGTPVGVNWLDASGRNDSSIRWISARPAPPSDYDISHVIQNGAERSTLRASSSRQLHQWRDAEDLQAADRDLRQPAGARSAHRQRVWPDHGVGRGPICAMPAGAARARSRRRRSKAPTSIWLKSSPK